ncbi:MAG TPA: prolyl-tRNA synthetase [Candidatus Staskawiczbacteria bacterium]|nr:prolyl-tRNA synthetase [Candidatus Staskawiczbacteria bacterium]
MLQSKLFYKTEKPDKSASRILTGEGQAISNELLVRAGFLDQLMAGVYTFLPLGFKVLQKIENIIRKNMESAPVSSQEILMPVLQPKENWQKTGRWQSLDILFKVNGSGDKEYALGPTHEEVVSPLAKKIIFSYRDLPLSVFQIQTKFRDELRAKSGILRTREFLMKDMYSFHATQEDLDKYYDKLIKVYLNIFSECGIGKNTHQTLASGGSFSKYSDEFQTITDVGEDIIYVCKKCKLAINKEIKNEHSKCPKCGGADFDEKKAVEVGNIFKLGNKYSLPFDLKFKDKDGSEKPVIMGCFGIGLGRLMGAVAEINYDEKGLIWPKSVAPFLVHLIQLGNAPKINKIAKKLYTDLQKKNIEILYDDRQDKTAGEKFAEADLIGIPYRIVVSENTRKSNSVEIKERNKKQLKLVKINSIEKTINK